MLKRLLSFLFIIFLSASLFAQEQALALSSNTNVESEVEVTFKPNPLKNTAQVDIKGLESNSYKFLIYDITGRLVRQYSHKYQSSFVFDREDLEKGFYFYKLITPANKVKAGRFQVID